LAAARDSHTTIQNFEAGLALADDVLRFGNQMSPRLRETLQQGRAISPETYDAARSIARRARGAALALFDDCDVLLTPAAPGAAPLGLGSTGDPRFNKLWTLLGLPCVAVPGLADAAGLPLGVQVVAPFGRDAAALSAGALLENLLRRL
jgi:Asp-tRNA(Asn)/Glu-tRNA(Gln) amidotransferase A subunit family amidase